MSALECNAPKVGEWRRVPAIYVSRWYGFKGWLPIMGPLHSDAEILEFPHMHYHPDWRFVGVKAWKHVPFANHTPSKVFGIIIQSPDNYGQPVVVEGPTLRRMKCKREFPAYPAVHWAEALQNAYACKKLKNGTCPHRGLPLASMSVVNGVVRCPGHGLLWNVETGDMVREKVNPPYWTVKP